MNKFKVGDAVTLNGEIDVVENVFSGTATMSLYRHENLSSHTVSNKGWEHYTGPFLRGETLVWQGEEVEYIAPGVVISKDGTAGFAPTHNLARRKRTRKVEMRAYVYPDGRIVCRMSRESIPYAATIVGEPFEIEVPE
jgi:hypothetical protein